MKQWRKSASVTEAARFALRGVFIAASREQNVRIHLIIGTLVVCALLFLHASALSIAIVLLAIALVLGMEMINTCLELFADVAHPEYSKAIGDMKDIAAGGVLIASVAAGIIGLLVFSSTIGTYLL